MASVSTPEANLLVLAGEIDLHESPRVKEKMEGIIARKPARVLVDMTGVSYIDSSGIAALIDAMQRVQAGGGKLALFGIRENVRQVFQIARLDQIFSIYPDKGAASAG